MMCEPENESHAWLDAVIPKIAANLGISDAVRYELSIPGDSLYLSNTHCVNVYSKEPAEGKEARFGLVVKRPPQHEPMREAIRADSQFHNEVLFYRRYAGETGEFPRCVFVDLKPPRDTIIVLENVTGRGYELAPYKYDAPLEYTLAAMREIGRFHAKGYAMKEQQPEKFSELVRDIQETRFLEKPNRFQEFIDLVSSRSIDYLRRQSYDPVFCEKMDGFLSNAYENVMMKAAEPGEPLSVLCHGDFTLNNTLFKKEADGTMSAMLIDFATIRYGLPVIDLSTYFCLSAAKDLEKERFAGILGTYHRALLDHLSSNNVKDLGKYSYEVFYEDFKRGALLGFVIATFFLSTMMGKATLTPKEIFEMDIREAAKAQRANGGDEVSKLLADMLLNLKELGCLEHIL